MKLKTWVVGLLIALVVWGALWRAGVHWGQPIACLPQCVGANLSYRDLRGVNLSGAVLHKADLSRSDLTGADLSHADLRGANLRSAQLNGANLTGANLTGANLRQARLINVRWEGANLRVADFTEAVLTRGDLTQAYLDGAIFRRATLIGVTLERGNLRGVDFTGAKLAGARLAYAELSGANFTGAMISGADFYGARLNGAVLAGGDLSSCNFVRAELTGADLTDADLSGADMMLADLTGANLEDADLSGVSLDSATLRGANLVGAFLYGTVLVGADLQDARFTAVVEAAPGQWWLKAAEVNGASFDRARFGGVDLSGVTIRGGSLNWADLSGAHLIGMKRLGDEVLEYRVNLLGVRTNEHIAWPQLNVAEADQTYLSLGSWRTEDTYAMERMLDAFHTQYPTITVHYAPVMADQYDTWLRQQLTAGCAPDVIYLRSFSGSQDLIEGGWLAPLSGLPGLMHNFSPEMRAPWATNTGEPYAVPFIATSHGIYYNQDIFEQLDLRPPTTWEQLLVAAQRLADAGITPFANGSQDAWTVNELVFMSLAPNFIGGRQGRLAYLAGTRCFDDAHAVAAFQALADLSPFFPAQHAEVGYEASRALFAAGEAAMLWDGSWNIPTIEAAAPDFVWSVFAVPPPAGNPAYLTFQLDAGIGLNAASSHKAEARLFLEWLAQPEAAQLLAHELPGFFPMQVAAPQIENEHARAFLALNQGRGLDVRWAWPVLRSGSPSGYTLMEENALAVLNGELTAQAAADNLQKGLSVWFEPARRCQAGAP